MICNLTVEDCLPSWLSSLKKCNDRYAVKKEYTQKKRNTKHHDCTVIDYQHNMLKFQLQRCCFVIIQNSHTGQISSPIQMHCISHFHMHRVLNLPIQSKPEDSPNTSLSMSCCFFIAQKPFLFISATSHLIFLITHSTICLCSQHLPACEMQPSQITELCSNHVHRHVSFWCQYHVPIIFVRYGPV